VGCSSHGVLGSLVLAAVLGAGVPAAVHAVRAGEEARPAPPTVRPETPPKEAEPAKKGLTDEEMQKLAEETARKGKFLSIGPVASKNQHLGGETAAANPLANHRFWCVLQARGLAGQPIGSFICVDRTGAVTYPFKAEEFGKLVAAENKAKWQDQDYVNAAALYVHLTALASQDGLKLCKSADDFMAVKFNMPQQGPAAEKREAAAKVIEASKVVKAADKVTVTLCVWHLIGGSLKQWTVEFGPEFKADSKVLGRFGGGGYD
jgi:hypothetical protein